MRTRTPLERAERNHLIGVTFWVTTAFWLLVALAILR